jgi:hypothetical protein
MAGFSKVDIMPPLERIEAYGIGYWYARHVRFTGIRDPLFVRTLVVGTGKSRQVIVSVDSILDSYGFIKPATARIADALGVPAASILITCTHTHSSPLIGRNNIWCGSEYGVLAADRIVQSACEAARDAVGTSITVSSAPISDVLFNRRPLLANGKVAELHQPVADSEVMVPGPVNDRMTLVRFRDRTGKRIGGLCHFGIHGVAVQCSDLISSDCMGRAIQAVEREQEPAVILHLNGACGDIDPKLMGSDEALQLMTERLTEGLGKLMNAPESTVVEPVPMCASRHTFVAARRQTRPVEVLERRRQTLAARAPSTDLRHHSGSGYELFLLSEEQAVAALPSELEISYQLLRCGTLIFVGVGGEVFTRSGLEVQASLRQFLVLPIGLAGGAAGYLPPEEMYGQGGYEVACAQWCPIAPGEPEKLFAQIEADLHRCAECEPA